MNLQISETTWKNNYLYSKDQDSVDYYDIFTASFDNPSQDIDPKACMVAFFYAFDSSFMFLLKLRNKLVKPFGLSVEDFPSEEERQKKLQDLKNQELRVGGGVSVFEILSFDEREILTGSNEKHLNFRCSFIYEETENQGKISLVTVVKYNNLLGRLYFFFVKPFHIIFLKRILKRMVEILN